MTFWIWQSVQPASNPNWDWHSGWWSAHCRAFTSDSVPVATLHGSHARKTRDGSHPSFQSYTPLDPGRLVWIWWLELGNFYRHQLHICLSIYFICATSCMPNNRRVNCTICHSYIRLVGTEVTFGQSQRGQIFISSLCLHWLWKTGRNAFECILCIIWGKWQNQSTPIAHTAD